MATFWLELGLNIFFSFFMVSSDTRQTFCLAQLAITRDADGILISFFFYLLKDKLLKGWTFRQECNLAVTTISKKNEAYKMQLLLLLVFFWVDAVVADDPFPQNLKCTLKSLHVSIP